MGDVPAFKVRAETPLYQFLVKDLESLKSRIVSMAKTGKV
jgi:hypothetical protein